MRPLVVEYPPGAPPAEFAGSLREALLASRLVVTTGVDPAQDARRFWDEVSETIGDCTLLAEDPTTGARKGEKWMEVRYDARFPNAYRHSSNAQPLHTDGSYLSDAPEVIFFYCLKQARSGGETIFVDGERLVELLADQEPALLDELRRTPVTFSKANERRRRRIIDLDGDAPRLTWNYFTVDASEPQEVRGMAERFHAFLQERVVGRGIPSAVRLLPGEAVFFHDERVLHGRNAFEAHHQDDRFMWKAGFTVAPAQ